MNRRNPTVSDNSATKTTVKKKTMHEMIIKNGDSKTLSASSSLTVKKQFQVKQLMQKEPKIEGLDENSLKTFDNGTVAASAVQQ